MSEKGIEDVRKFADEQWSEYIRRLQDIAINKGISEDLVLSKLRKIESPKDYQTLFYSFDATLDAIIWRIEEWEVLRRKQQSSIQTSKSVKNSNKNHDKKFSKTFIPRNRPNTRCYKCNNMGHIAPECKSDSVKKVSLSNKRTNSGVNEENVLVNGLDYISILDTGSCVNIISSVILKRILHKKIENLGTPVEIFLLNGQAVSFDSRVELTIEYNGVKIEDWFYISDKTIVTLLIGFKLLKMLERNNIFPVECTVNTGSSEIISWSRPTRNREKRIGFQNLVDDLERKGIIELSTSLWCHPVVIVKKKTGKFRFTLDLTRLNNSVTLDEFQLPRIDEILSSLTDQRLFTILDLKDGFFQVNLRRSDKEKIAFLDTHNRLLQFRKMPQGFENSPAIFQRGMYVVLQGLVGKHCLSYIDDILIYGKTIEEHDRNVIIVKKRLRKYGLIIDEDKCMVAQENVVFLGYNISKNQIKPTLNRSQAITSFPQPKSFKDVRRFIGMTNYDRKFIKDFSQLAKRLYELLEEKSFKWKQEHQESFDKIRANWEHKLSLRVPNDIDSFTLESDASDWAIGAVLLQNNTPIGYISRLLKKAEINYSITEKEVLASLWAMEKFEFLLAGKVFNLVTDHKAIENIQTKHNFGSARTERWRDRLSKFNFKVCFRPGAEMIVPDAISRSLPLVLEGGRNNEELKKIVLDIHIEKSHRKDISKDLKSRFISVSQSMVNSILESCLECKRFDAKKYTKGDFIKTYEPGELVGCDLLEITPKTRIVNLIDYFTRKLYSCIITTKDPWKIVQFLERVKKELNIKTLLTDNGGEFINKELTEWCVKNDVTHKNSIPYYHPSNGRVERVNRTIRNALKKVKGSPRQTLYDVVNQYNSTIHRGIGMTPDDAIKSENRSKVIENQNKYAQKFVKKPKTVKDPLDYGCKVLVRNETKKTKMEPEFHQEGFITKVISDSTYEVETSNGNRINRHISQLKRL